ncbi:MAG: OmpW/AlkL family protein [Rickettsiales bacterium]
MKKLLSSLLIASALQTPATIALAEDKPLFDFSDKSRWIIRMRAINVEPAEGSSVTGLATKVDADGGYAPEFDFTYFFTDHVAAELIAATSNHDMSTTSGVDLGDVWVLPPTINLQYHFNPKGQIRPYAGAGLGYIIYWGEDSGAVNNIEYDNGIAYSFQAGVDFGIDEHWAINADVKKLIHNTDVSINNGAIRADVDLNPWVFGVGVAYRF